MAKQEQIIPDGYIYNGGTPPAWNSHDQYRFAILRLSNDDSREIREHIRMNSTNNVPVDDARFQARIREVWDGGARHIVLSRHTSYRRPESRHWLDYDLEIVDEPVNAAATYYEATQNLSQFADEMMSGYHEQSSLFDDPKTRSFDSNTLIPVDEQIRNRTFIEAFRIMLGTHWGRIHQLLALDPSVATNKAAWQALETQLRAEHDRLLKTCGNFAWPSLVKEEMPVDVVREKIDAGKSFHFSTTAAGVWTIVDEATIPAQGEFEQRVAIDNYRLARRERSRHHAAFRFPAAPADVVSNIYPRQRAIMASLRELYQEIQTSHGHSTPNNSTSDLKALMAMKLIYLTAMATLRERNNNDADLTKIEKNTTIGTESFANVFKTIDSTLTPFLGVTEHWSRRGFIYWDGSQFVRDNDGSHLNNEGPSNQGGDQRIGTHVQVIDLNEIDHEINPVNLASGWQRPWLRQDYWEKKIAHELALTGVV